MCHIWAETALRLLSMKRWLIQPCGCSSSRQHQVKIGRSLSRASSITRVKVPSGFCQVLEATMYSSISSPWVFSCSIAWPIEAS